MKAKFIEDIKNYFKKKPLSARDAYMMAKYNIVKTDDELLEDFFKNTEDLIKSKSTSGNYCAMLEVDEDLTWAINDVVSHYKKMGFQVRKLTNKTQIDGEKLKNLRSTFIILVWNTLSNEPALSNETEIITE